MQVINSPYAPSAIGTYSQAICCGDTVYLSGQIPLVPESMELVSGGFVKEIEQVIANLKAVCVAAGGDLSNIVKLSVYLTDLANFSLVNEVMTNFFTEPYPARVAIGVKELPKGAQVEMDGVMYLGR